MRDPSIWYNSALKVRILFFFSRSELNPLKTYFVFSTDNNIGIFTATTLAGCVFLPSLRLFLKLILSPGRPWTSVGSVLPSCSEIELDGRCDPWAPDVNFINGLYTVYYAVSTGGSQTSAIGVATSPSMEPGTWTDLGEVISSTPADVFNASACFLNARISSAIKLTCTSSRPEHHRRPRWASARVRVVLGRDLPGRTLPECQQPCIGAPRSRFLSLSSFR